jgi:hypothetical protein
MEAMKGVLASLFASQRTLKSIAPNFKWAGLGNLLGDYGEFIAIEAYSLQQAPRGANGYVRWAKDVVAGLRGTSPWLEQQFDDAVRRAEASLL